MSAPSAASFADAQMRTGRPVSSPISRAKRVSLSRLDVYKRQPQKGVDAINIAAHAVIALQEILAREVAMDDRTMVLVGTIHGGSSCNTLSGSCAVEISVRAADREMRAFLKERVKEICEGTAATFRGLSLIHILPSCRPGGRP